MNFFKKLFKLRSCIRFYNRIVSSLYKILSSASYYCFHFSLYFGLYFLFFYLLLFVLFCHFLRPISLLFPDLFFILFFLFFVLFIYFIFILSFIYIFFVHKNKIQLLMTFIILVNNINLLIS